MSLENESGTGIFEAIHGSHLHWSAFRENVLGPFRIQSLTSQKSNQLPTPFLARLQVFQGNLKKYDSQRQAWRADLASGRGLGPTPIFPPNLLPPISGTSNIRRCTNPRMSREGLPLRVPSEKNSLYELPTAKPTHVCGFNMEMFDKTEEAQLGGGLTATGTIVDFNNAEVLPGKTLCCPFLAFEKFEASSERQVETARNACAVTGAQCLRGQQQLFHRAFGLQTVSQPPIIFTCALSNEHAVINYHFIDEEGNYTMAALCKFDLNTDDHFNNFQAWIEAIESWASLYLLPRVKGALGEIMRSNPSPPPSPAATSTSQLSIDTNSDTVPAILKTLRQLWPMISWHNDVVGETPINSSVAQCGTPLPTLQSRTLSLPTPRGNLSLSSMDGLNHARTNSSGSQRFSDTLTPIRTEFPLSARPRSRQSLHARRWAHARSRSGSRSDDPTTPESPCRPPSLSPCTPGPEAPVSSKSPMLVMQKRLEVAMDEIQELRAQVDDLQAQINGRTETLEKRLECLTERQDRTEKVLDSGGGRTKFGSGWVNELEALVEEEILTPIPDKPMHEYEDMYEDRRWPTPPDVTAAAIPGSFPSDSLTKSELHGEPFSTEELVVWCFALLLRDDKASMAAIAIGGLVLFYGGVIDGGGCLQNVAFILVLDDYVQKILWHLCIRLRTLYREAQTYELGTKIEEKTDLKIAPEELGEHEDEPDSVSEEATVPLVLA